MKTALLKNRKMRRISIAAAVTLVLLLLPLSWAMGRASVKTAPAVGADALSEIVRITKAHADSASSREMAYLSAIAKIDEDECPDVDGDTMVEVISVTGGAVSFAVTDRAEDLSPYGRTVYYNIDPVTGEHLTLADVMGEGWRERVLRAVLPKIMADSDTYDGVDAAPMINESRMFCLTGDGGVGIVFDAGEIAPDGAGIKIYTVKTEEW